jgi:Cu(I)/Ag(I) efflux system periplasmic protein CusF
VNRLQISVVAAAALAASSVVGQTTMVDGQVIKIDEAASKITIKHGPLKQFDMDEPMAMVYRASDPAALKNLKAGDQIKFSADRINGQFTVMKIEKSQ